MNEKLENLIQRQVSLPVAVGAGILALGGGLVIGYIFGKRNRPLSPEDLAEIERIQKGIEESRQKYDTATREEPDGVRVVIDERVYRAKNATPPFTDVEVVDETRSVKVIELQPPEEPVEPVTIDQGSVRKNIFAQASDPDDDWYYDDELKKRSPNKPYVVHRDEFFSDEDEHDFVQHQLTFYNGDGVLVDEQQNPIGNPADVVGEMKFGHGSGDPNVVYIRNERLKADYEVWLDAGRYDVEVAGADIEDVNASLQHSAPRKFRPE